jgi:hypothetical protein
MLLVNKCILSEPEGRDNKILPRLDKSRCVGTLPRVMPRDTTTLIYGMIALSAHTMHGKRKELDQCL